MNRRETVARLVEAAELMGAQTPEGFAQRVGLDQAALYAMAEELVFHGDAAIASIWLAGFNTGYLAAELAEGDRIARRAHP